MIGAGGAYFLHKSVDSSAIVMVLGLKQCAEVLGLNHNIFTATSSLPS